MDYRGSHQPLLDDARLSEMDTIFGDVYSRPDIYVFGEKSWQTRAIAVLMAARGKPEHTVQVYRAVPPGITTINQGDWVSTVHGYARQHGLQANPADDWPVLTATVRAGDLATGGSDLMEWGYCGPTLVDVKVLAR